MRYYAKGNVRKMALKYADLENFCKTLKGEFPKSISYKILNDRVARTFGFHPGIKSVVLQALNEHGFIRPTQFADVYELSPFAVDEAEKESRN